MKKFSLILMSIVMIFVMISCEKTGDPLSSVEYDALLKSATVGDISIVGIPLEDFVSGNAVNECAQTDCNGEFSAKIEAWDSEEGADGEYVVEGGNTITISNSGEKVFDWESEWPVCAVIVKGGEGALVYYMDGATEGSGFIAPMNPKNGKPFGVSHVTFCYAEPEEIVIAIKSYVWNPNGIPYFAVSSGNVVFDAGWCADWPLGINDFPGTSSFSLYIPNLDIQIGNVTVSDDEIIIDMPENWTINYTHLYVGSLDYLLNNNLYEGCPAHANWRVNDEDGNTQTFYLSE